MKFFQVCISNLIHNSGLTEPFYCRDIRVIVHHWIQWICPDLQRVLKELAFWQLDRFRALGTNERYSVAWKEAVVVEVIWFWTWQWSAVWPVVPQHPPLTAVSSIAWLAHAAHHTPPLVTVLCEAGGRHRGRNSSQIWAPTHCPFSCPTQPLNQTTQSPQARGWAVYLLVGGDW